MQGAAIAQLLNTLAHLALGVVWFLYLIGYDALDQGPRASGGYKWLIFYVVLIVLDVIESAVAGAAGAAKPLLQHTVYHWVADVLTGAAVLNHFVSEHRTQDARASLQWATLPALGVVLYLALEIQSVYHASSAYADASPAPGSTGTADLLSTTSRKQRRANVWEE